MGRQWPLDCISATTCFIDLTAGRRGHAPKNSIRLVINTLNANWTLASPIWSIIGRWNLINNRTVKFVISYRIVFKQVEVSTTLASVESTGYWLHAGSCLVFVRWVGLETLHDIVRKSTSVVYGKKHGIYLYLEMMWRCNWDWGMQTCVDWGHV